MKIIHTSDWHIGQTLYQYGREEEHKYFFKQLKSLIIKEKPDVLIVSGDIFHSSVPSVTSQRLYYHIMVELSRLDDDLQIVVIAGNHDSPSRLEAPHELWNAFNVNVIGLLDFHRDKNEDGLNYEASKLEIPITRKNEIIGWVLAVPFINAGNYPSLNENDSYSNRVFSFYNNLKQNLRKNPQYNDKQSVIATGHFVINGVDFKGHNILVGGLESVDSNVLSSISEIDYWALGHIHRPQYVGKNYNMRYSGSPFALTFNEDYRHSVSVVTVENHKLEIKIKDIDPLIPIVDFPFKPNSYNDALPYETVMMKLFEILDNKCYIRLHVQSEMPLSDTLNASFIETFKDKKAKFCGVQVYLPKSDFEDNPFSVKNLDDLKLISPFELGCSVYQKKNNADMPNEMKMMFKDICDELQKQEMNYEN